MLMQLAKSAGFDAVKFQKRTIDVVYTPEELDKPREHPWGTTNGDLKRRLEFGEDAIPEIDALCPGARHRLVRVVLGRGHPSTSSTLRPSGVQDRLSDIDRRWSLARRHDPRESQ